MAISLTIGLIVMVAALNIVASLILLVMEKHRDIAHSEDDGRERAERDGHLHAAGADHRHRRHDGRRVGRLRAVVRCSTRYQLIRVPDGRLPDVARAVHACCRSTSLLVVVGAVLICFLATIYPSRQAAQLDPVAGAAVRVRCNHEGTKTRRLTEQSFECLRAFVSS